VYNYGLVPYVTAWDWQKQLVHRKMSDHAHDNVLLLLEHPNVYTLGKASSDEYLKFDRDDYEIHKIERGGQVTHHCPGQLVAYPILNLKHQGFKLDLHWYLRQLEQVVIQVLKHYNLEGRRDPEFTGVWVGNAKVCAIGLTARKWITFHGIGLNVNCDLEGFKQIVPCGIDDPTRSVTSISQLCQDRQVSMDDVKYYFVKEFERVFQIQCSFCVGENSPI
jgi:lipoyl(octanoyl) transferase